MKNRIRELREERGWSMRALAERMNTTGSNINKLEKGQSRLDVRWIERFAKAFDVTPAEILGEDAETGPGFREDVEACDLSDPSMPKLQLTDTQFCYVAASDVLDQIGIVKGGVLVFDMSPDAMAGIATGDVVIAQIYDGSRAQTVLRQFVAPSQLISNSATEKAPIINLRTDDAAMKGVLVGSYAHFRRPATKHGKA